MKKLSITMKQLIGKITPKDLRNIIRSSKQGIRIQAKKLASTSKRLDICSSQIAHVLHLSGNPSLSGKVCLEIGTGWTLSHSMVCHLLGAKRVIATDVSPLADPLSVSLALNKSIISFIRDVLSPFEDHATIRTRLDKLLSIRKFDFDILKNIGIEYISPIDLAKNKLDIKVDFIFSNSVLEHVPCEDIHFLLKNITTNLNSEGTMIHNIHLEDHKDIYHNPFGFLAISSSDYTRSHQASRGNRIRKSGWQKLFNSIPDIESEFIYSWTRNDRDLPETIDQTINYNDEIDLRVSHISVYSKKTLIN